jgi:hypothetical protein
LGHLEARAYTWGVSSRKTFCRSLGHHDQRTSENGDPIEHGKEITPPFTTLLLPLFSLITVTFSTSTPVDNSCPDRTVSLTLSGSWTRFTAPSFCGTRSFYESMKATWMTARFTTISSTRPDWFWFRNIRALCLSLSLGDIVDSVALAFWCGLLASCNSLASGITARSRSSLK